MLYNFTHALAVNVDRVSPGPVEVGDFLFWLVIFFAPRLDQKLVGLVRKVSYLKSRVSH